MIRKLLLQRNRWINITLVIGVIMLILISTASVQAYTVMVGKWASTSTTYVRDSSYTSQGSGWSSMFGSAASNWTSSGAFGFSSSSSSSNHIQAADIADDSSCSGCLALTSVWGNPIYQFRIEVNIGSGYAFYDGTQAPSLPSNYYDLRSIMRHELGHAQGLCHSSNSSYLMYRAFGTGQIKLVDTDAINGSEYLYLSGYDGPDPEGSCQLN